MFNNMKIYTVHIRPGMAVARQKPVFIKEGFNFWGFFLTLLWTLYQRLWLPALCIFLFNVVLLFLLRHHVLSLTSGCALHLALHFIVGFHGNDWLRARLTKRDYILADISAADSRLRAEQRYFERVLA